MQARTERGLCLGRRTQHPVGRRESRDDLRCPRARDPDLARRARRDRRRHPGDDRGGGRAQDHARRLLAGLDRRHGRRPRGARRGRERLRSYLRDRPERASGSPREEARDRQGGRARRPARRHRRDRGGPDFLEPRQPAHRGLVLVHRPHDGHGDELRPRDERPARRGRGHREARGRRALPGRDSSVGRSGAPRVDRRPKLPRPHLSHPCQRHEARRPPVHGARAPGGGQDPLRVPAPLGRPGALRRVRAVRRPRRGGIDDGACHVAGRHRRAGLAPSDDAAQRLRAAG